MRAILLLLLCLAVPASAQTASVPLEYRMVRDTRSGAVLPRLADTRDPHARAVNRRLDSLSAALRCLYAVDRQGNATEHHSDVRVEYAADSILSMYVSFSGDCGGAHPINGENLSVTFDLRTGNPVPFEALFAYYERDAPALVRIFFPAQIAAAERMAAQGREPRPSAEEECLQFYTVRDLETRYFAYTLSDSGLVVEPVMAHAFNGCTETAVVPYDRLGPYAAPGGLLARLAARRRR